MAIAGTMLVMSSVCHSTSYSATSLERPLSVAMSIWRTEARHSLDSISTMVWVVMIWPAFAWLVMRFAVCTAEPKISRFSTTTGPKLQPIRMATVCSSTLSAGCSTICFCIWEAAFSASSAVGNVAITSSPMVLMTVPLFWSVAVRITSMQTPTMSRARRSPSSSYSLVLPTTSANTMASSVSFPIGAANYT